MTWRLFLDDERFPSSIWREDEWFIARTANDAVQHILANGIPRDISFDHDLGEDQATGADFVHWMIEHMLDEGLKFPANFSFYVHSMNPIGAVNIQAKMENAIKHIGYEE